MAYPSSHPPDMLFNFIGNSDFRKHKNKRMFAEHVLDHAVMGMTVRL